MEDASNLNVASVLSPTDATRTAPIVVRRLGLQDYVPCVDAMRTFSKTRDDDTPDEIWLLQHPATYTLGQAGRSEHLHGPVDAPVVRTERGGQVTYHGPGQVVVYPLIDIRRRNVKVREFVALLEQGVIATLAAYNLRGLLKPGAPGVYVDHDDALQKVAALGLKIVSGRSFHGVSLNVAMDLAPYARIDACGYPGLKSIDLRSLGVDAGVDAVGNHLVAALAAGIEAATR